MKAPQPPPPIRALAGDGGGGLSPQIHSMLVPRKVGNSLEVTVFASPTKGISGAVTPWSAVFIFVPHGNIAFITVALIVHILQSALTMTISICQYSIWYLSHKYFYLLLWNVHLDRTDLIGD